MKLPAYVYIVQHETTGKVYVGLSSNPRVRIQRHISELRAGRHPVEDFQTDYDKYGEHLISLILEKVNTYEEKNKEFKWQIKLRTLDRRYGYNYKDPVTKWYNRRT